MKTETNINNGIDAVKTLTVDYLRENETFCVNVIADINRLLAENSDRLNDKETAAITKALNIVINLSMQYTSALIEYTANDSKLV